MLTPRSMWRNVISSFRENFSTSEMFLLHVETTLQNHLQGKASRWQKTWKCHQNTFICRWRPGVSRTLQRWGSPTDVNSQGETVFVVCLRVICSRNPLASRQLISPDFARQHSSVIRPSAGQMSWQEIRQVQWKPACFPAHLPQNRTVTTWHLGFHWNAPMKYIHLELLQPALQMNPDQLQAEMGMNSPLPWCSPTC